MILESAEGVYDDDVNAILREKAIGIAIATCKRLPTTSMTLVYIATEVGRNQARAKQRLLQQQETNRKDGTISLPIYKQNIYK